MTIFSFFSQVFLASSKHISFALNAHQLVGGESQHFNLLVLRALLSALPVPGMGAGPVTVETKIKYTKYNTSN